MSKTITFNEFNNTTLEYGKIYKLYYDVPDSVINDITLFDSIINELMDKFYYNPDYKTTIKFDNYTKQFIVSFYLIKKSDTLQIVPIVIAGYVILGVIGTLLATHNFKPVKVVVDTLESTLTSIQKTAKFLPYILGAGLLIFILSYSNTRNLKKLF